MEICIGDIPRHWTVHCLKRLLKEPLTYGLNEAAELEDRSLPRYIRITDFDDDGTLREEIEHVDSEQLWRSFPRVKHSNLIGSGIECFTLPVLSDTKSSIGYTAKDNFNSASSAVKGFDNTRGFQRSVT